MRSFAKTVLIIFTGIMFMSSIVQAGESEDIAILEQLLGGKPAEASQFNNQFLEAVPLQQINTVLSELYEEIGKPTQITVMGDEYNIITNTHTMPAIITLDETRKIAGLFLRPPVPLNAQLSDLLKPLADAASETSYLIIRDGTILAQKNADTPMAIGSAFKLAILKVLQDDIEAGNRQWDDVTIIPPELHSLPSGILQNFPDNAPITLHTLASLMISQSDNTATDILLALMGRDRVSAYLTGQFVLSTRELFQLKEDIELADEFSRGDMETKQSISDILAKRALPSLSVGSVHYKAGVEWYMSAKELCTLIEQVQTLDIFDINPGLANPVSWGRVAYKGGSEIGVLNMTTWVLAKGGHQYCVVFTANNTMAAIVESEVSVAYAALLGHLAIQN